MAARPRKPAGAKPPSPPPAPPAPARKTSRLNGSLDRVDPDGTLEGWCWSPDEPMAQRAVAVLIDGVEAARFMSDQERGDLVAAGVGKGRHAFRYRLDLGLMAPGRRVTVTLRDLRSGEQVGGAVDVQWPDATAAEPGAPPGELPTLSGHLDRVSRDGWVSGWAWYPDRPGAHAELVVLVDDERVGTARADLFRPDLQQAGIGDGTHGFSFALPYAVLADKGTLRVTVQEAGSGRNLSDPVTVRLGRMAAAEERIIDLERQVRLLRGQIEELVHLGESRDEDRAARDLFQTVAEFFADLAKGGPARGGQGFGAAGLAGALEDVAANYPTLTLAQPEPLAATVVIAATAPLRTLHRCLAALHEAGIDRTAEIVLLDDGGQGGGQGGSAALLPSVVRNLRYVRLHDGSGLIAGRNAVAQSSRAPLVVFLAPQARVLPGWLDELAGTFAREPEAAAVGGRLVRDDGLMQHALLLADDAGALRDPTHLAPYDATEYRFLRRADALPGQALAVRREVLLGLGGFATLYGRFGHAAADLCVRLRAAGWGVLFQPLATAAWPVHGPPDTDAAPPDFSLLDEDTLRLRARLEGQTAGAARFAGHALVIDDDLPRPDRDAGSIATFEQMVLLRRLGWRVTFCPVHALSLDPTASELLARNGIEVVGPPEYGSVTQYMQAFGAGLGLVHIYRYANVTMLLDRVRELAPDARLVFATADLHFLREQRRAELAGQSLPEAAREEEVRCMLAADATIVTNDQELALLQPDVPPEKLVLLRWIERPRPVARPFGERHDICFIGNYRHPPNLDGVEWFLANVFPLVRQRLPGVRIKLAGSGMPSSIRDFADEGVEILGWVEDLSDLFGAVRVSVAPLRFGAGFKGKVATSLAYGLPVVGSSISLEGTGLEDGDGVLVADDADAFADAVVRAHDDAALWQELSERGVERVTALYSPEAALDIWRRLLIRLGRPVAP